MSRLGVLGAGAALTVAGGVATLLTGHVGPASATGADVVVVHGTAFPSAARAGLSLVGCDDMYAVSPETPQPMIGQGPGDAPVGQRSLAYDPAGGNAIGPAFRVESVASTTTASMAIHPWGVAATGVGYLAYQAPEDVDSGLFWLGRTSLSAPGGVWTTINVAHRAFTWTQYDLTTMQVTAAGPDQAQPVSEFTGQHGGDGPGVFTVGFGCNGTPFNLDDLQISSSDGSTTYDLEGLTTSVTMAHSADPSGAVTLRGTLRSGSDDVLPDATLRLEQSDAPDGPWRTVGAVPVHDGVATTTVAPQQRTWYRWRFVDRPLAAGSLSGAYAVDGSDVEPSASPTAATSSTPSSTPTRAPSASPTDEPSTSPTANPTDDPTEGPSESPTATASPSASDRPSAAPSPTAAVSPSASASASDRPSDPASASAHSAPAASPSSS